MALQAFLNFFDLVQINNINNCSNRLLDLVVTNYLGHVSKSDDVLLKEDAYHPALNICLSITNNSNSRAQIKGEEIYNFRKANYHLLYELMLNCDWSFLNNLDDVNIACDQFYNTLKDILNICVPTYIPGNKSKKYPPWFNGLIIKNIKTKFSLWKLYKKTNDLDVYNQFKILRSRVNIDIDIAHRTYLRNIELNVKNDVKSFWGYINSKTGTVNIPNNLIYGDVNLDSMQDIVNGFASFFSTAFTKPVDVNYNANVDDYNNQHLHFAQFNTNDILTALRKLKPKFTKGPDGIPAFIIRDCAYALAEPLTILFNLILRTCMIPNIWKRARICAVFKKGDRNNVENYRPITIICNFAKVLEIALHDILYRHVQGQISPHQHGFMRNRSTTTNLFCITQFVAQHLDMNVQVDVIYTDFSKAFDRLDHGILLNKLEKFGLSLPLLNLFKSYLSGRTQYVDCRGFISQEILVSSGVPQGSILGPLLFILFINDIVKDLDVHYLLYADDVKIFCAINNASDCLNLQNNLNKLNKWCVLNNLPLNASKCNVMTFSRKLSPIWHNYILNNVTLSRQDSIKDLGVIFDTKLSFNFHVNEIIKSSYKSLGFVIRNSLGFTDIQVLMLLFNALVKSKLEYAAIIWQPGYIVHTESLENIQRRFLKFLSFKIDGQYPHIGIPQQNLLNRFSVLSLHDRRKTQSLIFLNKLINNKIDCPQLLEQLNFYIPRVEARLCSTFYLATPRTNLLKFSPLFFMCENCNNLQDRVDIFSGNYSTLKKVYISN